MASTNERTIPEVVRVAAERFGQAEAVVDGATRLTFTEFAAAVDEVACALIASGVEPGDRVATWAPNGAPVLVVAFGVYAAGAVLVPLNTRYKTTEAEHVLETSSTRLLFVDADFLDATGGADLGALAELSGLDEIITLTSPSVKTTSWAEFLARGSTIDPDAAAERRESVQPDDPSDIIFTSGTTGSPKGAVLRHGASVHTYDLWSELVGLREGDRYLVVYPLFHTAGLKSGALASLIRGCTIVPLPVFDVEAVVRTVVDEQITMLPGPPTVFQTIFNHPDFDSFDMSSVRLSVTGAAVVPVEIVVKMKELLQLDNVVTGYGLTETHGTVSMCRFDDPPDVIANTVGRPLPGVEVRVVDDDANDVAAGEPGEFLVRGFNVMTEYFANPEATAETIDADGWLATGDIGFIDDDGNLHITDRKKDMFIVGGFNAYPAEIEQAMLQHPDIAQVSVIGVPDERLGEIGCAFVIPRTGAQPEPDEIIAWCRETMANFKVPRRVVIVDDLPTNPTGKVQKFVLRDRILGGEPS